jgi:long-chain acyl-CoA synthetase
MEQYTTLPRMIRYVLNTYRNSSAFNYREGGEWRHISTEIFLEKIRRLSLGLRKLGLKKGDCVGLMAKPSPYWLIIDLSIIIAGGVSVPLFPFVSRKNFEYQVHDSNMKYLFVVGQELWSTYSEFRHLFHKVITLDVPEEEKSDLVDMRHVMLMGDKVSEEDPALYINMSTLAKDSDLATIIYTSGSTGQPKGVELTHKNFVAQIKAGHVRLPLDPRTDKALSCLPLAHIFERTLVYFYISSGASIYFVDDIKKVAEIAREIKPTVAAMVPRLIEKIFAKMESSIDNAPTIKRTLGKWAMRLANISTPSSFQRLQTRFAEKLVYSKLRRALGGNFRAILLGGASLNPKLCQFFLNIGVPLYQGYGLTETSPVISMNFPGNNKVGTVGLAFPEVDLALTEDGEIITRGPSVMRGYHNNDEATSTVIDAEGWFHTGDKGTIDEEGYLKVTGRVKEIFKTSGGKMVSPVPIEQALSMAPLIDMAMVIAEGRRFASCLLFPDFDVLNKLKVQNNGTHFTDEEYLDSDLVRNEIAQLLHQVNDKLNRWEKIRQYRFVTAHISVETGELTPTLKMRRMKIEGEFSNIIESMYQDVREQV